VSEAASVVLPGGTTQTGTEGNDTLTGGIGADLLSGLGGNDTLAGLNGIDTLLGGDGADLLDGGTGDDTLDGGAGDDTLVVTDTDARIDGGAGTLDTARFGAAVAAGNLADTDLANVEVIEVSTTVSATYDFSAQTEALRIVGGLANDTLLGGAGGDTIDGAGGSDVLRGNGGDDLLIATDADVVIDGGQGTDTAQFGSSVGTVGLEDFDLVDVETVVITATTSDTNSNFYNFANQSESLRIFGNSGNDRITAGSGGGSIDGGAGNDTLSAGIGADSLFGGAGDDNLNGNIGASDTFNGGAGFDAVSYASATSAVTVTLNDDGAGSNNATARFSDTRIDTLIAIEQVSGGTVNDVFMVQSANVSVNPLFLRGNGGNDRFESAVRDVAIFVDYRDDTVGNTFSVSVDLAAGTATDGRGGTDTLVNIAAVRLTANNDVFAGSEQQDRIRDRGGNDTIDGRGGSDIIDYANATAGVSVNLALGTVTGGAGNDTLISIENAFGSSFADTLRGDATGNVLRGNTGDDLIDGGTGGVDLADYAYASTAITVTLNAAGTVTLAVAAGDTDTLVNIDGVRGSSVADRLVGDATDNVLRGNGGNDVLDGGSGNDTADYGYLSTGVVVSLDATGAAAVVAGAGDTDTLVSIEHVTGGNGNDVLTGNGGANVLTGGSGVDTLIGGGGNDTLVADDLDGTIEGGDGTDTVQFRSGVSSANLANGDLATVEVVAITNTTAGSYDFSAQTEALSILGGTATDTITGGSGADVIDGGAAADLMTGGAGDDTIFGGADDTLLGGDGNDVLVFAAGEADETRGGAGTDTLSFRNFTQGFVIDASTVANVDGASIEAIDTGDGTRGLRIKLSAASVIAASDTDTLRITAGVGETLEFVDAGWTLTGTANGVETYAKGGATVLVSVAADVVIPVTAPPVIQPGTGGADSYTGDTGDDTLTGLGGNDTLTGLGGNDTLDGGLGNDTLTGGVGDTLLGGEDNDLIILDGGFAEEINAGLGTDTVSLRNFAQGALVDLSVAAEVGNPGIERIDTGAGTSGLKFLVSAAGINALSDTDTLTISAGAGETVVFADAGWLRGDTAGGFTTYTNGGTATVLVSTAANAVVAAVAPETVPFSFTNLQVTGATATIDLVLGARAPLSLGELFFGAKWSVDTSLADIAFSEVNIVGLGTASAVSMTGNINPTSSGFELDVQGFAFGSGSIGSPTAPTVIGRATFTFADAAAASKLRLDDFALSSSEINGEVAPEFSLATQAAGSAAADILAGIDGAGASVLNGAGGNDILIAFVDAPAAFDVTDAAVRATGGVGNDVFVVGDTAARIKILDFTIGQDVIDISSVLGTAANKTAWLASAVKTDIGSGAEVSVLLQNPAAGPGHVEIFGVSAAQLTTQMFDDSGSRAALVDQIRSIIDQTNAP
jgi:Ca2+-binding RTX toxin-like protein